MSTLTWITEKELEREINNKGDQFRWKKTIKIFIAVVRKRGNVSGHHGENERQRRKSEQEHIKNTTKKFLEFFSCSRAKQWQRNVQKKGWCTCKVGFMLIRPTDVFWLFSLPSPLTITRCYISFE